MPLRGSLEQGVGMKSVEGKSVTSADLFRRGLEWFGGRVRAIGDDQWHLSYGDVPGSHYAFELANDLWIHGWDLARAIGADERIDPDVAETLYRFYQPLEPGLKVSGMFGPQVDPPPGADVQTKLLAVMGRRSW